VISVQSYPGYAGRESSDVIYQVCKIRVWFVTIPNNEEARKRVEFIGGKCRI
jgi:hypothetical protein